MQSGRHNIEIQTRVERCRTQVGRRWQCLFMSAQPCLETEAEMEQPSPNGCASHVDNVNVDVMLTAEKGCGDRDQQ